MNFLVTTHTLSTLFDYLIVAVAVLLGLGVFILFALFMVNSSPTSDDTVTPSDSMQYTAERVDGHTIRVNVNGRSFHIQKDRGGQPSVYEVDKCGNPISDRVGVEGSWRVGQSPSESLVRYVKRKVEKRERIPGDGSRL